MTAPMTLILRPHDTLFLRDGRPFNQGDQEQAATSGVFPPNPPTVVGAVRAALARAAGWSGGAWSPDLTARLGNGVDWSQGDVPLGPLRFTGPLVLRGGKPLFTAPLCLLVKRKGEVFEAVVRLRPGKPLDCDLGRVALPVTASKLDGGKAPEGVWINEEGLRAVLNGDVPLPGCLVHQDALWQTEMRVGIARDEKEGALYAAAHVRLRENVTIAVSLVGAENADKLAGALAPLGGEGRSVWIETGAAIDLPGPPALEPDSNGMFRYTVVLLTPAYFGDDEEDWPWPGGKIRCGDGQELPGQIISACAGKPLPVGGWDGEARWPLPLRPLAPAGSVWFLEADAGEAPAVLRVHGQGIGCATAWGFGLAAIGRWDQGEDDGRG